MGGEEKDTINGNVVKFHYDHFIGFHSVCAWHVLFSLSVRLVKYVRSQWSKSIQWLYNNCPIGFYVDTVALFHWYNFRQQLISSFLVKHSSIALIEFFPLLRVFLINLSCWTEFVSGKHTFNVFVCLPICIVCIAEVTMK